MLSTAHRPYQPDQAQQRFHRPSGATRPSLWTAARATGPARYVWSRTMTPIHAGKNLRSPPWPPAHTGSPSRVAPGIHPGTSMKSSRSGAILRPIASPTGARGHVAALDQAIHDAVIDLNRERIPQSVGHAKNLCLGRAGDARPALFTPPWPVRSRLFHHRQTFDRCAPPRAKKRRKLKWQK